MLNVIPKIADFGLAKILNDKAKAASGLTQTGAILGTPSYMAPEQASGKNRELGPPADIYALGVILYECLTGRPPFRAAAPLDTIRLLVVRPGTGAAGTAQPEGRSRSGNDLH